MVSGLRCPPAAWGLLALLLPPLVAGDRSRSCPQIEILNGRVRVTGYWSKRADFSCDEGFKLMGTTSAQCPDGKGEYYWSAKIPVCIPLGIECPPPPDIANGSHTGLSEQELPLGSAVTYSCNQGFSLVGEASINCTNKDNLGEWSGPAPQCKKVQCPKPEVQSAGMVSTLDEKTWYNVNETIPFTCSPGYHFSSPSHVPVTDRVHITCLADGSWTALPECEKQSASDVCEGVPKPCEFLDCHVPLVKMKELLELQKLYLEIEKLKQEMKLQ